MEDYEKNEKHIFDLPNELLLRIFKYCVENINSLTVISKVCQRFSVVVTHPYLYTTFKILREPPVDLLPIVKCYRSNFRIIHLEKVTDLLTNQILTELNGTRQISAITIKSITLCSSSTINTLCNIVEGCRELKRFKLAGEFRMLPIANWTPLLNAISLHPLEEFTFNGILPSQWEINAFLSSHANTLKCFKTFVQPEMSLTSVSFCTGLTKLCLNFSSTTQPVPDSIIALFRLENLTYVSFRFHHINGKQIGKFFSRPCCFKIKTIKLYTQSYRYLYTYIFSCIMNFCVNVETIYLRRTILPYDDKLPFEVVLNLLQKCKYLKHISLTKIDLLDALKLDQIINNLPALISFETCATIHNRNELNHYAGIINNNPVKEAICTGPKNTITCNDRNTAMVIETQLNKRLGNLVIEHIYDSRERFHRFEIYYPRRCQVPRNLCT